MAFDSGIFRAYDIRGKVGESITPEVAEALGRAFGTYIGQDGGAEIAVGRDNRTSGEELQGTLIRALVATGCTVYDIGLSTSPALYFAVGHWGMAGGISVSGSHNPPDENGFKLVGKGNRPIAGEEILKIKEIMDAGTFRSGQGRAEQREIKPEYFERLKKAAQVTRPFRVVVDTGNGVAGLFAPVLLREIGCEVIELYCDLDPTFPNHLPDPQMPENVADLQKKVRETGADLGLAFDGDGDRIGVIDELGERHEADYVLALLARALLAEQPGSDVIVDIKCSQPVIDDIRKRGGEPVVWKTGHSLIKLKMRQDQVPLAGEASGHIFYGENYFSDDAIFTACKLLTFLSQSDLPLSAHLNDVPRWHVTPEVRVPCPDDKKVAVVEEVAGYLRERYPSVEIDGIRVTYPDGWALVRASNTGPNLTLRFESKTEDGLKAIQDEVMGVLRQHVAVP